MTKGKNLVILLPLLISILLGAFFRFYKLDWGDGFFFHPDEYHIAAAVERLSPTNLNPQLFSYGSFSVYLIYFSRLVLSLIDQKFLTLNPFLIGRFYSAIFSTLTIIIIYLISSEIFKKKILINLPPFLVAITPGLIQQAHFSTPESILTFWITLSVYLWIRWLRQRKVPLLYLSAFSLGMAVGTKVTALLLSPILIILPFLVPDYSKKIFEKIKTPVCLVFILFASTFLVFPYAFLDFRALKSTLNYEGAVASGEMLVFYTRQFIETKPVLFQLNKILFYTLGLSVLLFSSIGLIAVIYKLISGMIKRRNANWQWMIILFSFSLFFFPNSFLFAKWTRFINPTLPFFAIFSVYSIESLSVIIKSLKIRHYIIISLALLLIIPTFVWTYMFFSIYTRRDIRVTATDWINKNIPQGSLILTETGNMLEVPLQGTYKKIPFDFYNLENNPSLQNQLIEYLDSSDYFIVQSRRIFMNQQKLLNQFPKIANFYNSLFSGKLGFQEIKEFNSFPKLVNLEIDDERAEETWSVFDHPVIRIYKKVQPYSAKEYEKILEK